ncbi:MAG: hypothetical protein JJU34_02410 [Lunatimonas sp.]|uniref:hypothetical protein n=1 Tax=Lunatimonas sp. TaxID=2060141 RepID=UPI00263AD421|nr:hypothetical protein [Lunatimonas sp.]MCC5936112.1 hypothetical protein [Lunatimonas sp.]
MKKTTSDALIQKLVKGKISREEFEQLLLALEDEEQAVFLENSMRDHFNAVMDKYEKEQKAVSGKENSPDKSMN